MLNRYPLWKYLLILSVISVGVLYALPNLYAPDYAVQVSGQSSSLLMSEKHLNLAQAAMNEAGIEPKDIELTDKNLLLRFNSPEQQLLAQAKLKPKLGDDYVIALNLAQTTPDWLASIGGQPLKRGLDLAGGVHFLLEVQTDAVIETQMETYFSDIKRLLRTNKLHSKFANDGKQITLQFKTAELRRQARTEIAKESPRLVQTASEKGALFVLALSLGEQEIKELKDSAVNQNLTTLRNRVNELGVAEPLVQKQGANRIVVQLPGVQDTAEAKRIIGKTATLEFRLEANIDESSINKELFPAKDPMTAGFSEAYLERDVIITGEYVSGAQASFDENSQPQVSISLNSNGGTLMHRATRKNIKRRLGVLFVERKTRTIYDAEGNITGTKAETVNQIISLATIQSALGTQFRVTGLDSTAESSELALLLRAGALAAPIDFVEERTVGPSLGAENIRLGVRSVQVGLGLVLIFMLIYYRVFGLAANLALTFNLVLLVAVMSILSATLTLPGIAGIVLTVGMAVDANVLIFARIREELKNGLTPQAAINAGYERAFVTIMDANLTTLLVALILYAVGTGPIKGFAITLSIGIVTSMFTAIMGTRAIINLVYGGRKLKTLSI